MQPFGSTRSLLPNGFMWLTEDDVAERLPDLKRDATAWLGTRFTGQFSLAGAQAKTALLNEEVGGGFPRAPPPPVTS